MIINLTPHSIEVYSESQFVNLEQTNPTTWIADSVDGEPIAAFPSMGSARIAVTTVEGNPIDGIPTVTTQYGELTGIPETVVVDDVLIVSLPTKSMAEQSGNPLAKQMVTPYKVVRSRENGSLVLGCMGFSR